MLRIVVIVIAILAGGGAGWLTLHATWREPVEPVTVMLEEPKVTVLTARADLMRGARIEQDHLVWTPWPADQVRAGMVREDADPDARDEMAGRVLRSNLYSGEPVREQHLAKGAGGFLATVLQPGMLAVGVEISDDRTAGGFILPNDRVDVLYSVVRDIDGDGTATGAARTVLTNVRVLAIGQTTFESGALVVNEAADAQPGGDGSTLTGTTATLEVSTEQAEVLLAATASGQINLALRAADDFGLSGIGDLAMIEGFDVAEPASITAEPAVSSDLHDSAEQQREVTIISTGIPEVVLVKGGHFQ